MCVVCFSEYLTWMINNLLTMLVNCLRIRNDLSLFNINLSIRDCNGNGNVRKLGMAIIFKAILDF